MTTVANILGLDLGTKTGWATESESGVSEFRIERGESAGMRFLNFRAWIAGMLDKIMPSLVAYEMPHMRGGAATEVLVGMQTRVMEECAARGIEYTSVHTATLKKWATGDGRADKNAMIEAAERGARRKMQDDNEADAYLVMLWARKFKATP